MPMKDKERHIWSRILGGIGLGIYLLLALLNSSVVQSYIGAAAGSYFSKEWGGKVRIGAIHASLIDHVILEKIELISPTNDTIYYGDRIACRFKKFPFHKSGLSMDRVMIRNGRYHFAEMRRPDGRLGINLDYIIDYYDTGKPHTGQPAPFIVEVGELRLRNVDYIQDLPEPSHATHYEEGVDISHMRYYGTSGYFRNVYVNCDSVTCRVVSLSTTEASGLRVIDLSMDVEVSPHCIVATNMDLQTADSRLFMDARLYYHGWDEMQDYLNTVRHDVTLKTGTEVNLRDAAYWAPELWGIDCKVAVQGHIHGTVSDMQADGLIASFGESSKVFLDGSIQGLPYIKTTRIDADVHRLHTNYDDLAAVRHPEGIKMLLPEIISQMKVIDMDASLHGRLSDCEAYFNINSLIGDLEGHAKLAYDSTEQDYTYVGDLDSRDLGIRPILPNEWVSRTGMHLSFQGTGFDSETLEASMEGRLYNTQFRGHNLSRTTLSAELAEQVLNVDLQLKDTLINLDATLSADLAGQRYSGDIYLDGAQLTRLKLLPTDTDIALTTHLAADLQGSSLETLAGTVSLKNTRGHIGSRRLELDNIDIAASEEADYRQVNLSSDWMRLRMRGYFQYADLPMAARDFCNRYLPAYYNPFRNADGMATADGSSTQAEPATFDFDIVWDDAGGTFPQLVPEAKIATGTSLHGNYSYGESLKAILRSDLLAAGGVELHDVGLSSNISGSNYQCRIKAASLASGEIQLMENIQLTANLGSSISTLALKWDDNASAPYNEGDIELFLNSSTEDNRLMIAKPTFYLMGQRWTLVCQNGIWVNKERLKIDELRVYGLEQSVTVKTEIAGKEEDYATATFDGFSLSHLSAAIFPNGQLAMEGALNGTVKAMGFATQPYIDASLTVDNSSINGQPTGRLDISSRYKADEARLYVDLLSELTEKGMRREPVQLHGFVSLDDSPDEMAFDVAVGGIRLQALNPILEQLSSNIDGMANGHLRMYGAWKSPQIDGYVAVRDGRLALGPTGATYLFGDTLAIDNSTLTLDSFAIRDLQGNQALADGTITLGTDGLLLDLDLNSDRITALDKESDGGSFYGKLLASVRGSVRGPADKLAITANATALEGSELYVPISNQKEVSENEFIRFYNSDSPRRTDNTARPAAAMQTTSPGIDLMLNVAVTPGMKLHLPMDFQQLEANVTAVGRGDIKVSMQGSRQPTVLGDYEFTSGSFSLSLMQLITKTFAIEEGSTINIPGSFEDASFNINAVYNLRTTLSSLMGVNSASSGSENYIPVQDVITLSGTINDPAIKFDIRLPNAEQSVTDQVFSYIDRTNELDLLNQSVSLLLFGQFSNNGSGNALSEGIDGMGLLASSASAILSNMVKIVDVNLKYQNATSGTASQWDVGISKQWNKLYFESSFGYGTNSELDAVLGNVLVGDVEMGYKFTPYFNFYGFQRTNTSYFTRTELPYKQGLGVKLSKDFDSWSELFLRKRKKRSATEAKPY